MPTVKYQLQNEKNVKEAAFIMRLGLNTMMALMKRHALRHYHDMVDLLERRHFLSKPS
jgi:hypothetical protein